MGAVSKPTAMRLIPRMSITDQAIKTAMTLQQSVLKDKTRLSLAVSDMIYFVALDYETNDSMGGISYSYSS